MTAASITRHDPHCVGWARASASLWGMADDHDLDEPICLSECVPVRVRRDQTGGLTADRNITFEKLRQGRAVMLRIALRNGKWIESEVGGVKVIDQSMSAVVIALC